MFRSYLGTTSISAMFFIEWWHYVSNILSYLLTHFWLDLELYMFMVFSVIIHPLLLFGNAKYEPNYKMVFTVDFLQTSSNTNNSETILAHNLSPMPVTQRSRCSASSHYLIQCWHRVNYSSNFILKSKPFNQENTFKNVVCIMMVILSLPHCVHFPISIRMLQYWYLLRRNTICNQLTRLLMEI